MGRKSGNIVVPNKPRSFSAKYYLFVQNMVIKYISIRMQKQTANIMKVQSQTENTLYSMSSFISQKAFSCLGLKLLTYFQRFSLLLFVEIMMYQMS